MPAPAAPAPPRSPWILNRGWDLLLFIGTPLVLLPLFAAAQVRWTAQEIYLWVGAFGALGHHLPGMIRAYGDGALFDRFKVRFVVAPVLLLAVCIVASMQKWEALNLVAFVWGVWHGMMQTYGFCRIYDMKRFAGAAARARWDFWLCGAWFLGGVVLSPMRGRSLVNLFYESGGPSLPLPALDWFRWTVTAALVGVTLAWAWVHLRAIRRGEPVPSTKIAILVTSLAFWWYCNIGVANILVGIALFEVFHDVQYLSIVWLYNRARVEKDRNIGGFMRFVFRRSGALAGLYVGLVLAYGALGLVQSGVSSEMIQRVLLGLVTASALMHFYYDGFIWKVRESATSESLGVAGSPSGATAGVVTLMKTPWLRHAARWAVLVVPFGMLCLAQAKGWRMENLERREQVARAFPRDAQAQLDLGKTYHEQGRLDEAGVCYEAAAALKPELAALDYFRGLLAGDQGDIPGAEAAYRRELQRDPQSAESETNLAAILLRAQPRAAQRHLEHSLLIKPRQVLARQLLGDLLIDEGDYAAALVQFETVVKERPDFKEAADRLAFVRALVGQGKR